MIRNKYGYSQEYIEKEFKQYEKLIYFVMKKYFNYDFKWYGYYYSFEDAKSIGDIGLYYGIITYNVERNIQKTTYYSEVIKNEILKQCICSNYEKNKFNFQMVSLNNKINNDNNQYELIDIVFKKEDYQLKKKIRYYKNTLKMLINKGYFNEQEQFLIKKLMYGYNQTEISKMMGCTRQRVSQIYCQIVDKAKKYQINDLNIL